MSVVAGGYYSLFGGVRTTTGGLLARFALMHIGVVTHSVQTPTDRLPARFALMHIGPVIHSVRTGPTKSLLSMKKEGLYRFKL